MKRYTLIVLLIMSLALFGLPYRTYAQLPFGGFNIISIPCFYVGAPLPYGFLTFILPAGVSPPNLMIMTPPLTVWFAYFDPIVPTVPLLGLYDPVPIGCVVGLIPIGAGFHVLEVGSGLP